MLRVVRPAARTFEPATGGRSAEGVIDGVGADDTLALGASVVDRRVPLEGRVHARAAVVR